jgi:MFS family permease
MLDYPEIWMMASWLQESEDQMRDRRTEITTQAAVMGLAAMTIMANATIAASLPGLSDHFAALPGAETMAALVVTLPSLSIVLTAGGMGWLADRYDRQRLLALVAGLYALGGTVGLWADSLWLILAGRLVLGVGVAGTMTLAFTWASDLWQGAARARFLGRQGAAVSAGGIAFMLLGGMASSVHWRGAFAVYALVLPVAGFALWALRDARGSGTAEPQGGVPGGFPLRAYAFVATLAFLLMVGFYMVPTRLPYVLRAMGVANPAHAGAIMATTTLIALPFSLAFGRIRARFPAVALFGWSLGMIGLGLCIISVAQQPVTVVVATMAIGSGLGLAMPNAMSWFMAQVPANWRGRASGLLTMAFFTGQFASPLISALLVAHQGLAASFAIEGSALMAVALLLFLTLARRTVARQT